MGRFSFMEETRKLIARLLRLFITFFALVMAVFLGLLGYHPETDFKGQGVSTEIVAQWQPNSVHGGLENMDPLAMQGYLYIKETPVHLGPMAKDSTMRFAGNNLACANCHLLSGTQAGAASWVGVLGRFPQFGGRSGKVGTIEDRINGCMERSLNGKKLPIGSPAMQAIKAYMAWISEGLPGDRKKEYDGYAQVTVPNEAVDLAKGKAVYDQECVLCHGNDGQGVRLPNDSLGYQYPPLWGNDSYNNGAGMHRVLTAMQFIKSNMPYGQATWDNPKLTDSEAYHVAGYINSFDRPQKGGTENDYPDKNLKPVSTPYGPWPDAFSAEQHKYGPFPPIIDYYKKQYAILKTK